MSFKDSWQRAAEPEDDFQPADKATYHIKVVEGNAWTTGDGREFAKLTLEIIDGPDTGRRFDDFMNFNNDIGTRRARENLSLYGIKGDTIEDLEDLDTAILELAGTEADVTTKWSSDNRFLNVTVQRGRTGKSDVPANQESFDTGNGSAVRQPANAINGNDDDDPIPFHHEEVSWDDRYHPNR